MRKSKKKQDKGGNIMKGMKSVLKKILSVALCSAMVGGMGALAPAVLPGVGLTASASEDQYLPFTTLGIIGGFNDWSGDVEMSDPDGDGVYEGVVTAEGTYEFKVRADGGWDYSWGEYEADYDRTQNSQTNCSATVEEGCKLVVKLDTTKVSDLAMDNDDSWVHESSFDFDSDGYEYWPVIYEVVADEPYFENESEVSDTKTATGIGVTMTGAATGNTAPYSYAYVVKTPDGKWNVLKGYSSDTSCVFTPEEKGTYTLQVKVKNSADEVKVKNFDLTVTDELTNCSEISSLNVGVGTNLTLTGKAGGGTKPYQYAFVAEDPEGKWSVLKNFSTDNTCTFAPDKVGVYNLQVKVKDSKGTTEIKTFEVNSVEQYKPFTTLGVVGEFNDWENDIPMTDADGDGIYEASFEYPGGYYIKVRADGEWDNSWGGYDSYYDRTYQSNSIYVYTVEGQKLTVYLDTTKVSDDAVKNSSSAVNDDDFIFAESGYLYWPVTYTVTDAEPVVNNDSTISATKISQGMSVTINGEASGNTSPYQYAYVAKKPDGKWVVLKDYSSDKTFVYTPEDLGNYTIQVKVKNKNDTVKTKDFALTVTDELVNLSEITNDNLIIGVNKTITAKAAGGTKPYQYAFVVTTPDGKSTVLKGYSADDTCVFKPAAAGEHKLQIKVKDSKGIVRVKEFTLTSYDQYRPFTKLYVRLSDDYNKNIAELTDPDGDGIYEAEVYRLGGYDYRVYADDTSDYWSRYDSWYERTTNNYNSQYAYMEECQKLIVRLDTTKFTDEAYEAFPDFDDYGYDFGGDGYRFWRVTYEVVDSDPMIIVDPSISETKISQGMSVTIKGEASGNTEGYQYAFVAKGPDNKWTVIKDYSRSNTCTFTPASVGNYTIQVKAKDNSNNVGFKDLALTVTDEFVNLSEFKGSVIVLGKTITLRGEAAGGTKPYQFAFVATTPDGKSTVLKGFSTDDTCTFTPTVVGEYKFQIKIKDNKGAVKVREFTRSAVDQYRPFTRLYVRLDDDYSKNYIEMTDPDYDGIYEAEIYQPGSYYFRVYADNDSSNYWSSFDYWNETTWNSDNEQHAYVSEEQKLVISLDTTRVSTDAIEDLGIFEDEDYGFDFGSYGYKYWPVTYEVVDCGPVVINNSTISATKISQSMSVTLKGAATGNTGEYQYAFVAKGPDGKWVVLRDYSSDKTFVYTPEALGNYTIQIKVKDYADTVETKSFALAVTDELANTSEAPEPYFIVGVNKTIKAAAVAGTKPYQYAFVVTTPDGNTTVLQGFSTDDTCVFKPAAAGEHKFQIKVKDSKGTVKVKSFTWNAIEQYRPFTTLSIRKSSNYSSNYSDNYVEMTDPDGDGIYEAEIFDLDSFYFRIYADDTNDNYWSATYWNDEKTWNNYDSMYAEIDECQKLVVKLDTTRLSSGISQEWFEESGYDFSADGYKFWPVTYKTEQTDPILNNDSTISDTKIVLGMSATLNAGASGNTVGYSYSYAVCDPNGEWTVLQDYDEDTTYTYTPEALGTYTLQVKVRDDRGNVKEKNFTLVVTDELVNFSKETGAYLILGLNHTLKGVAAGGTAPYQYAYVVTTPDGKTSVIKGYSADDTCKYKPTALGTYKFQIKVKDSKGAVRVNEFAMDAIERNLSYSSFGIRIGDFDDTSNDVIMTDADNDGIYEGEVYKIGEYYFRVYADNDTNNHWSKYYYYYDRTRNSYEENYVTLGYCKKLIVRLDTTRVDPQALLNKGSNVNNKNFDFVQSGYNYWPVTYEIVDTDPILNNESTISATNIATGMSVTLKGAASGNTGGYEYAFVGKGPDGKWTVLRNYSAAAKFTFTPAAVGNYTIQVKVRDNRNIVKVKEFALNVTSEFMNASEISDVNIETNMSVIMTGVAGGGKAPYQFAFVAQDPDGKWSVLKNYSSDSVCRFKPAAEGNYKLQVKAKDANGTVRIKEFAVAVKAADEQYMPDNEFVVSGSFNSWNKSTGIPMTDEDGDGVYEAEITATGRNSFRVFAVNRGSSYCWGSYSEDYDRTYNSYNNITASIGDGQKMIVRLDTTTLSAKAMENMRSRVNEEGFSFAQDGYLCWPVTVEIIGEAKKVIPFTELRVSGYFDDYYDSELMKDEDGDGVYEAVIYDVGDYYFRVYSEDSEKRWGSYEKWDDCTLGSDYDVTGTIPEGKKLIVRFDTNSISEDAYANPDSYVYSEYFNFNAEGYYFWPITTELVDTPVVFENTSTISADKISLGMNVELNASAYGNTKPFRYTFVVQDPEGKWHMLSNRSSYSSYTYYPEMTGDHKVYIKVSDKRGVVRTKAFTLSVTEEFLNNSTLSNSSIKVGMNAILYGNAVGGTAPYQFAYVVRTPDGKWSVLKNYSEDTKCVYKPVTEGEYKLQVKAKDSTDKVLVKEFDLTVAAPDAQYIPVNSFRVRGGFDEWGSGVVMSDSDGDGIYEAEINAVGNYGIYVYGYYYYDDYYDYYERWSGYDEYYDRTTDTDTSLSVDVPDAHKLIVKLDTTKIDDAALANSNSSVYSANFNFSSTGYKYWPVITQTAEVPPTLNNDSTISSDSIYLGESVTLSGAASGNTSGYQFAYVVKTPDGKWSVIKGFGEEATCSYTPASAGTHTIQIKVKDSRGKVEVKELTLEVSDELVNFSRSSARYTMIGKTVTLTGEAKGGTAPYEFAYVLRTPDNKWTVLKSYSTDTSCSFTVEANGTHVVQIKAKDSKGKIAVKEINIESAEQYKPFTNLGVVGSFNDWSDDIAMTDADNDGIYEAEIQLGPDYYEFKVRADGSWNYSWGEYNDYYDRTEDSQINCSATIGEHQKLVVRLNTTTVDSGALNNPNSSVNNSDFNFSQSGYYFWPVTYEVVNAGDIFENVSTISQNKITQGMSVTLTGAAEGNTGPYEFAYVAQSPDGKWTVLSGYSSQTSYEFTPASLGAYTVQVKAKDNKGTVKVKEFALTVTDELANISELSAENLIKGVNLTINGKALGGTKPYQYAFVVQTPDEKWTVLKGYSADTTCTFKPETVGNHKFQIKVKDSKGTVRVKEFNMTAVERYMPATSFELSDYFGWTTLRKTVLTDDDEDGIYVGTIFEPGYYRFRVHDSDYNHWSYYDTDYDTTMNNYTAIEKSFTDGKMLIVKLDTTKVSDSAKANRYSDVNDPDFSFAESGYRYWPVTVEEVDAEPILINDSYLSTYSTILGMSVDIYGDAYGNTGPYQYAYVAQAPDGKWSVLQGYSEVTGLYFTPSSAGKYTIQVKAKNSKGEVKVKEMTLDVSGELTNFSYVSTNNTVPKAEVTLSGIAAGGTAPYQYAYVAQTPDGKYSVIKGYSEDNFCTFKPSVIGDHKLQIKVKDSKGTVKVKEFDLSVTEQFIPFTTVGVVGNFNSWSNDLALTDKDGDGIYEAEITKEGHYEFLVRADGAWDYTWGNAYYWGDYTLDSYRCLVADVREGEKLTIRFNTKRTAHDGDISADDGSFALDGYKYWPVTCEISGTPIHLYNESVISYNYVYKGDSVTLTGKAVGGTSPYQFAYVVQAPDGKWYVLKNYSSDTQFVFKPASTGNYTVQIKAKDSKGTVAVSSFDLKVLEDYYMK